MSKLTDWFSSAILAFLLTSCDASIIGSSSGTASSGAVSSESRICSEVGIELLERGGNAADAIVGTTLCVGVVGMQHSGIGGGGFMLVRGSDGKYESIDFRESAPAAAFQDMFENNTQASVTGGLASGVPSDLRGLEYLHKKYGVLPWEAVVNPAVHTARYGFRVTDDLVRYMNYATEDGNNFLVDDPQWAIDFAPNGTRVGLNDTMTRKRYADTLEQVAKHGVDVFYNGKIAEYTISALQRANGTMTLQDLKDYRVTIHDPVAITYRGYKITSTGVPSGGSVGLSILKIIEGYNISNPQNVNLSTHRLNEAMRYSYAARSELGDPAFFDYMSGLEAEMLTEERAEKIRGRILDDRTRDISEYGAKNWQAPENHGTSHLVAMDATGLTISLTSTINLLFGSKLVVPETGVIMNNEMDDFSIPGHPNAFGFIPSPINYIAPQKRPLSSICPLIIEHANSSLYLTLGAAGGSRIITSTVQTLLNVIDKGMTLEEGLWEPRMHDQLVPARTTFEVGFDGGVVGSMGRRGHNTTWVGRSQSAVQGVRFLSGGNKGKGAFEAWGEPRQKDSGGLTTGKNLKGQKHGFWKFWWGGRQLNHQAAVVIEQSRMVREGKEGVHREGRAGYNLR